jgi:hypothetical protein
LREGPCATHVWPLSVLVAMNVSMPTVTRRVASAEAAIPVYAATPAQDCKFQAGPGVGAGVGGPQYPGLKLGWVVHTLGLVLFATTASLVPSSFAATPCHLS